MFKENFNDTLLYERRGMTAYFSHFLTVYERESEKPKAVPHQ